LPPARLSKKRGWISEASRGTLYRNPALRALIDEHRHHAASDWGRGIV
jgi:hypothetical protein